MKIEKNIPVLHKSGKAKYPFGDMEIGDSIFIVGQKNYDSAAGSARAYGQRHGLKFSCSVIDGDLRIWRIE